MADTAAVDPAVTAQVNALTQQLAALEKDLKASKEQGAAALKAAQDEANKKLEAAHGKLVTQAVRAAAREAGIIDDSLLDHLPIEGATYRNDAIEGVEAAIARLKEKHPKLFAAGTAAAETTTTESETTTEPEPNQEVEALKAKLAELEGKIAKPPVGTTGKPPAKKGEPPKKPDVMTMDRKQWHEQIAKTRAELARH